MAVLDPIPNNGSQVERAIRAWLVECTSGNIGITKLTNDVMFVTNDSRVRPNLDGLVGILDIFAERSEHDPVHSGNEIWNVTLRGKFHATVQPGQSNAQFNRVQIDQLIGVVDAAMRQTNDGQNMDATQDGITDSGRALATTGTAQERADNADMAEFTCLYVWYVGASRGHPNDDDGYKDAAWWIEERRYRVTACPIAID